ncbi:hypothetical protein [Paenibacillus silvae]
MEDRTSHSVWSAWIEINAPANNVYGVASRTPYGVRGLESSVGRPLAA